MPEDDVATDQVFVFPASEAQRSLWFLEQLAPGRALYNLHVGKRIASKVDADVLEASINEVVRRHESLRTAFREFDHEITQVIASTVHVPLRTTDLRDLSEDDRELEALAIAEAEAGTPFELARWPLVRTRLVRLDEESFLFFLTVHHILCDYWSLQVLEDELSAVYAARSEDRPSLLPPLRLQFADFSEWERGWLADPDGQAQLDHWTKQLKDLPTVQLPTDYPRPRTPTFAGVGLDFEVPAATYDALQRLGQQESATLFMVTLAALQTVLHRYTGAEDVVVGTSVANRGQPDVEGLIGYLVNTLVLRTDLSGGPTFRELIGRTRAVAMDAFGNQQVPFNRVVNAVRAERVAGDNPLFQVHFQLFSEGRPASETGLMAEEAFEPDSSTTQFDLGIDLWEYEGLTGHVEYSTEMFDPETVARLTKHLLMVLEHVARDPDLPVAQVPLLDDAERHRLLVEWNQTTGVPLDDTRLHQLIEAQAAGRPDAVAVICGSERLTYGELDRRATRLAAHLRSLHLRRGEVVAVSAERSTAYVVGTLAALKAGAAFLPVNLLDPLPRLRRALDLVAPRVLLSRGGAADHLTEGLAHRLLTLDPETAWQGSEQVGPADADSDGDPGDLAYVIFTSGSTADPRGVEVSHRAVTNHLRWMQHAFPLTPDDRTLLKYPLTFDAAVCELFCPLLAGATLVVPPAAEHWNVSEFAELCREQEITVLDLVPSMLDALLAEPAFDACRSIRRVICGGEELTPALCERFFARGDAELHNIYGPTETTIGTTSWTCRPGATSSDVPIGRPIANTRVYVLDRSLQPAATGVRGDLYVAGTGLARGYLADPATTADRFLPDPFSTGPGARMYVTGDRAWFSADGVLHFAGRADDQIKLRGFRVECGEVEAELSSHDLVRWCAVVPVQDDHQHARLVAYVVPTLEPAELWPSVGDYGVYDELLYYALTHDERRNEAYRSAIAEAVPGKVVVDVGTGADAILSRFCVDAGARHVYAIEVSKPAFDSATASVARLGLADRITVLHADSSTVSLPEPAEVCVSELIGMIGSSEGVVPILNDARRLLTPDATMVPRRCVTKFAPYTLPEALARSPRFTGLPRMYVQEVFSKVGHPFDLRLCIKNCPAENVLAGPAAFEDLDFTVPSDPYTTGAHTFTVTSDGRLDGFLFWLTLHPGSSDMIDSLTDRLSWLPVFMPAFDPGLAVTAGDLVHVRTVSSVPDGGRLPDYRIDGALERRDGRRVEFSLRSPHRTRDLRAGPFYDRLLDDPDLVGPDLVGPREVAAADDATALDLGPRLRQFLQQRLPEYMVPSSFVILDTLPSMSGGKLDLRSLARQKGRPSVDGRSVLRPPATGAEESIARVWCDVLNLSHVDRHDNFFDLGGDSLLITQVRARLERVFSRRTSIIDLFRYPTVSSLGVFLDEGSAEPQRVPGRLGDRVPEPTAPYGRGGG